jgi:hypothetical protein
VRLVAGRDDTFDQQQPRVMISLKDSCWFFG